MLHGRRWGWAAGIIFVLVLGIAGALQVVSYMFHPYRPVSPAKAIPHLEERYNIVFPKDMKDVMVAVGTDWREDTKWFVLRFRASPEDVNEFVRSQLHVTRLRPYTPGDREDQRAAFGGPGWYGAPVQTGMIALFSLIRPGDDTVYGTSLVIDTGNSERWTVYMDASY